MAVVGEPMIKVLIEVVQGDNDKEEEGEEPPHELVWLLDLPGLVMPRWNPQEVQSANREQQEQCHSRHVKKGCLEEDRSQEQVKEWRVREGTNRMHEKGSY